MSHFKTVDGKQQVVFRGLSVAVINCSNIDGDISVTD